MHQAASSNRQHSSEIWELERTHIESGTSSDGNPRATDVDPITERPGQASLAGMNQTAIWGDASAIQKKAPLAAGRVARVT